MHRENNRPPQKGKACLPNINFSVSGMGTYVQVGGETTTPGNPKHQMLNSGQKKRGHPISLFESKTTPYPRPKPFDEWMKCFEGSFAEPLNRKWCGMLNHPWMEYSKFRNQWLLTKFDETCLYCSEKSGNFASEIHCNVEELNISTRQASGGAGGGSIEATNNFYQRKS